MSDPIAWPTEAPMMTLPNTALFPHAFLPLHIFEPRYRQMLADVLRGNRLFAVAGLDLQRARVSDQVEPPFAVAGLGVVRASHENADGTSNLILQGLTRVRVQLIVAEEPYRRVAFAPLPSAPGAPAAELRRQRTVLLRQLEQVRGLGGAVSAEAMGFLRTQSDPESLVDLAAFTLCHDAVEKQLLLEEPDTAARYTRFLRHLRAESARLRLARKLQGGLGDDDIARN